MKPYLPTQPATLPYKGAPRGIHDLIMQQIQREDRGVEGFVRDEPQYEPANMAREATVNKKRPELIRNWGLGNIISKLAL